MKTIKYFVIGAMLTIVGSPAMAQVDGKAAVNQVKEILKAKPADADKQIATIAKPFKKDGATLTAIGREYFYGGNYAKATEYANMALAKNKKCGDAYVLLGDVASKNDNSGDAASNYQQAMYMDPTNPDGYRRYALMMSKADPEGSVNALKTLGEKVPGYPWEIEVARLYNKQNNIPKTVEYYNKVALDKMENNDLGTYGTDLFLSGDFDKSLEVAKYGTKKSPRYAAFNRLALFNNVQKQNWDEAIAYGNKLFNASDSAKFSSYDYKMMGEAYKGANKFDEAIAEYTKLAEMKDAKAEDKASAYKDIADTYKAAGKFTDEIAAYEKYLEVKPNATVADYSELGKMCTDYAEATTGDEQTAAMAKADQVYANLAAKFAGNEDFATYQRARIASITDPDLKKGAAKPYYDKLIEVVKASGNTDAAAMTYLKTAYSYNMFYAFQIKNDLKTAKAYAQKILEIDPSDETSQKISELK